MNEEEGNPKLLLWPLLFEGKLKIDKTYALNNRVDFSKGDGSGRDRTYGVALNYGKGSGIGYGRGGGGQK